MLFSNQSKHELFTQELSQPLIEFDSTMDVDTPYPLFEAGVRGGSIIHAITVVTDDTLSRVLRLYETIGGEHYPKETVTLPAATPYGTNGTNREYDLMQFITGCRIDGAGNRSLYLARGKTLSVSLNLAPATDKKLIVRAYGEHY